MKRFILSFLFYLAALPAIAAPTINEFVASPTGQDLLCGWDDSAGDSKCFKLGSNISITGDTINATGGGGGGSDNIYNTDGSLTGDRVLDGNGYNIAFQNLGVDGFTIYGQDSSNFVKLLTGDSSVGSNSFDFVSHDNPGGDNFGYAKIHADAETGTFLQATDPTEGLRATSSVGRTVIDNRVEDNYSGRISTYTQYASQFYFGGADVYLGDSDYNTLHFYDTPEGDFGTLQLSDSQWLFRNVSGLGGLNISTTGSYTSNLSVDSITASRSWTMPDQSGTVALTSDIGIKALDGSTSQGQLLSTGATGTAPNWTLVGINDHRIHIPLASGSGVTSGTISKTDYDSFAAKVSTGANSSLTSITGLTGAISTPTQINFAGIASPSYGAGRLLYDTSNESLTFYNNDSNVSLQVGQEEWIRVTNNTGLSIANGAVVYLSGATGGWPTIALAKADAPTTTIGAGLATETIANGATGYVTSIGTVRGIDTSAFTAGQTVYISSTTAGALTATAPTAPNYRYRVGIVGTSSATVGTIHVTPSTASLGNGAANQLFGINNAGTLQEVKSLLGTTNNISVTHGAGTITLDIGSNVLTTTAAATAYVPYTGATTNVNLGVRSLTANNEILTPASDSGTTLVINRAAITPALQLGTLVGSTSFGAIYGNVTPSGTNYALAADATTVALNAPTTINIAIGNSIKAGANSTGFGIGTNTPNYKGEFRANALGVTPVDVSGALALANTSAATLGAQQISPALLFSGLGWGTTAGTSQAVNFRNYVLPIQGLVPTGALIWESSIAGGAYAQKMAYYSNIGLGINVPAGTAPVSGLEVDDATAKTTLGASGVITIAGSAGGSVVGRRQELNFKSYGTLTNSTASIGIITTSISSSEDADLYFATKTAAGSTGVTERMRITGTNGYVGIGGTASVTSKLDVQTNALGVTQTTTSGIALTNTTAAANGAQQITPALRLSGLGWGTTASTSQAVDMREYLLPVQGTVPSGTRIWDASIAGGAYTSVLTYSTLGTLTLVPNNPTISGTGFLSLSGTSGGVNMNSGGMQVGNGAANALYIPAYNGGTNTTVAQWQYASSTNNLLRVGVGGNTGGSTLTVGGNYSSFIVGNGVVTTAASGTHTWLANAVVSPMGTVTSGGATVTNTASLYIGGASTAGATNYSLYVADGYSNVGRLTNTDVWTPYMGIGELNAIPNSASVNSIGVSAIATGTATGVAITSTNLFTGTVRLQYVSAATAGSTSALRFSQALALRGVAAREGGFKFVTKAGMEVNASGSRGFYGLTDSLAVLPNAQPSALLNIIAAGWDTTDTTMQIMSNDGTGTATKVNLGANFPVNTSATDLYLVSFTCVANCSSVDYYVERLNTGDTASGNISTDLPSTSTLLAGQVWANNGATASAITLSFSNIWLSKPH